MDMATAKVIASKNGNANVDDRHIVSFPDNTFGVYQGSTANGWHGGWPGFPSLPAVLTSTEWLAH